MAKRLSKWESKERRKRDHENELEENRANRIEKNQNYSSIEEKINDVYESFSFPLGLMNNVEVDNNVIRHIKRKIENISENVKIERNIENPESNKKLDSYKKLIDFINKNPIVATFTESNNKSQVNEKDNFFDNPTSNGFLSRIEYFLTFEGKDEIQLLNYVKSNNSFWSFLLFKNTELLIVKRIWWKTILGIFLSILGWIPLAIFLQHILFTTQNAPGFFILTISFIISRVIFYSIIEFISEDKTKEIGFKLLVKKIYDEIKKKSIKNKIDNSSLIKDLRKLYEMYIAEHEVSNQKNDDINKKNITDTVTKIKLLQNELSKEFEKFKTDFLKYDELYFNTLFNSRIFYSTYSFFNFSTQLGELDWEEYQFKHDEFSDYLDSITIDYQIISDELKIIIILPELKSFPENIYEFSRRNKEEYISASISSQKRKKYLIGIVEATIINILSILFENSFNELKVNKISLINLLSISNKNLVKNANEYFLINESTIEISMLDKINFNDVETKEEAEYVLRKMNANFSNINFDSLDIIKFSYIKNTFTSPYSTFLEKISNIEDDDFDNNSYLYLNVKELDYNHNLENLIKSEEYIKVTCDYNESYYLNLLTSNEKKRKIVMQEIEKRLKAKMIRDNETMDDRLKRYKVEADQIRKDLDSGKY